MRTRVRLTRGRRHGLSAVLLAVVAADAAALVWAGQGDAAPPRRPAPVAASAHLVPMAVVARETPHRIRAVPSARGLPALPPRSVAIPTQHVVAAVDVCQIIDGGLEPPVDVSRTCEWAGGAPLTATAGTSVVAGHINWSGVTGALGNIDRLPPGTTVYTAGADGSVTAWRVVSVVHRSKTQGIDRGAFVGRTGPRQLYLITCGGAFDAASGNYVDNIYLRAVPAPLPRTQPSTSSTVIAL